jgi:integral membrane protein
MMLKKFRLAGVAEGVSFLVLLGIAMPLKYAFGYPLAVRIVGSLHGLLFIVYVITAQQTAIENHWTKKEFALACVAAVLPFGPFIFNHRFLNGTHGNP